jgi:hypothetical protein
VTILRELSSIDLAEVRRCVLFGISRRCTDHRISSKLAVMYLVRSLKLRMLWFVTQENRGRISWSRSLLHSRPFLPLSAHVSTRHYIASQTCSRQMMDIMNIGPDIPLWHVALALKWCSTLNSWGCLDWINPCCLCLVHKWNTSECFIFKTPWAVSRSLVWAV